jgi:dCMP deaminase
MNLDADVRPDWNLYFIKMADLVSKRSTCLRRKVGAVLVKNNQVISSGYNGAPKNTPHCSQTECIRVRDNITSGKNHELCRGVHAEQNTIIQAAINGTSIEGSVLYCTNFPCVICAKIIINAEIKIVYIQNDYNDKLSKEILSQAGVAVFQVDIDTGNFKKIL